MAALADYEAQKTGEREADGQLALSLIARALGVQAPTLRPASTWKGQPPPEPILWRDYGHDDDNDNLSPVLSVGEVCLLSAAGGLGKSTVTVALAAAAAAATAEDVKYGAACGLRVRCGPVVLLSYEDSPARVNDPAAVVRQGPPPSIACTWSRIRCPCGRQPRRDPGPANGAPRGRPSGRRSGTPAPGWW